MAKKPAFPESSLDFTVCVLLYGDYPELALRCLSRLTALARSGLIALRIGANAISHRTENVVAALGLEEHLFFQSDENLKKYPMMKKLFASTESTCGTEVDLKTPFVMWFDDDSYITDENSETWLALVKREMETADLIGSIYRISMKGNQAHWIRSQPWYSGVPVPDGHRVSYCTGGWWTIRSEVVRRFHWPIPELLHRGGDVMLGELCRQQGLRMSHFREGIAINADENGKESKSLRRGYDSQPIGWD